MKQIHYISWACYALIAFMIIPVIRAQSDIIDTITLKSAYENGQRELIMSLPINILGDIPINSKKI